MFILHRQKKSLEQRYPKSKVQYYPTSFNSLWCMTRLAVARAGVCGCQNLDAGWLRAACRRCGYILDDAIFTVTLNKFYYD